MYILERQVGENGRDYALRVLKENIISLELKPGSMVSEKELAMELGVSRTPVREALLDLSKAQIVDVFPQRGSQISLISYELAEDTQFTRNMLEGVAVQLACEKATEEDILRLRENLMLQELHKEDIRRMMQLDDDFHEELFRIAGKMHTYHMLSSFSIHFDRIRQMALHTTQVQELVDDHRLILEAVEKRDKSQALTHMKEHLLRYKLDEKGIREKFPAEFFE